MVSPGTIITLVVLALVITGIVLVYVFFKDSLIGSLFGAIGGGIESGIQLAQVDRGAGTLPDRCTSDRVWEGGMCYKKCSEVVKKQDWFKKLSPEKQKRVLKTGFKGLATVCWPKCPKGFRDDGLYCDKKDFPWESGDKAFSLDEARDRCEKEFGKDDLEINRTDAWCNKNWKGIEANKSTGVNDNFCEKNWKKDWIYGCKKEGAIIYPKCPPGMKDGGITCRKQEFDRGVGKPKTGCSDGKENSAGLCYPKCKDTEKVKKQVKENNPGKSEAELEKIAAKYKGVLTMCVPP